MKLLVTDLDGTLYPKQDNEAKDSFNRNKEAVLKWIEAGNRFAVATARGVGHYPEICEKMGFHVNFIGGNGAENILENGELILKSFPIRIFFDVCRWVEAHQLDVSVSTIQNRNWYWNTRNNYPIYNSGKPRWTYAKIADESTVDPISNIERIAVYVTAEQRDQLKGMLIEAFGDKVDITTSESDTIDLGPLNSSKGITILELAALFDIKQEDIIVVGDSENDVPMFKITEKSYCIDHAELHVRESAWKTVASVADVVLNEIQRKTSDHK